jgi:hypothetical protein
MPVRLRLLHLNFVFTALLGRADTSLSSFIPVRLIVHFDFVCRPALGLNVQMQVTTFRLLAFRMRMRFQQQH